MTVSWQLVYMRGWDVQLGNLDVDVTYDQQGARGGNDRSSLHVWG